MRFALRSAYRELWKTRSRLIGVFFILILGFLGPLLSSALRSSVTNYIQYRSRQLLSADLAVANNVRDFKADEVEVIEKASGGLKFSRATEFVTMAKGRGTSTLVEVQAVDDHFPIDGVFKFEDGRLSNSAGELSRGDIVWAFSDALSQLGLKPGDTLEIGSLALKVGGVLKDAPGLSRGGVFAPRVFIGRNRIARTGLTELGSQASYRLYAELKREASPDVKGAEVKSLLENPDVSIRTPKDSTQSLERFFTFFNLYLSSVSMIIFALSWVSAFYILQVYLQDHLKNTAVLLTFGATRILALTISALQIFFVMLSSLVVSSTLVAVLIRVLAPLLNDLLPPGFDLAFSFFDFAKLLAIAVASSLAFLTPFAIRVRRSVLGDLLSEASLTRLSRRDLLIAYAPLAVVFIGLSMWLMNSVRNALILTLALMAAVAVGFLFSRALFRFLFGLVKSRPGLLRLVFMQLARSRFGVNLCFITILIGALVLNVVPNLLKSALNELAPLHGHDIPALFLFNIPESGVEEIKAFALKENVQLKYLAPLVLARLTKVNGVETEDDYFQRFPVRLTYRPSLIEGEKLVSGTVPTGVAKDVAAVSIEASYAERQGFKLGDAIEFEVQGVPVETKITSVRKVRWTDFNPNFFFVLQPGVIDDAPKTYLASLYTKVPTPRLQYDLVRAFPDVSVLDVGQTLDKIVEIIDSILSPVKISALVAVIMSTLILMGVIAHNLALRDRELDIQKLLGADLGLIRRLIVSEYAILAAGAAVLGSIFALLLSWVITLQIFDVALRIDVWAFGLSIVVTVLLTSSLAYFAARRRLGQARPSAKL